MESDLLLAASMAFSPHSLFANALGTLLGIIFGALPGLTATMGVALLLPLTFSLPTAEAFSALLGMYCGAIYGGSLTAILVGTPGTVAAAATMLEGPALTARGESKKALDMATLASFVGGIISCVVLITIAPLLARIATAFGASEYFAVAIFGMAVVASLAASNIVKGALSALIGLYLSTIGGDPVSGELRNTFGITSLIGGIEMVPVLVGLFAVAQIFISIEEHLRKIEENIKVEISRDGLSLRELFVHRWTLLRSSIIGVIVGIIPATGGGTASYIAYSTAQKYSKTPDQYGKGILEGIAATESANNATTGGALIPLLTLGVPGDIVTAIMLGALMIQGLVPGPLLFKTDAAAVYSIFLALIVANVMMLGMGLISIRPLSKILLVPTTVLMPSVIALCVVGAYAVSGSFFDLYIVAFFGLLGYGMHKVGLPAAPLLLSMILAPIAETNFRRALVISQNDYSVFFTSPIAASVLCLALLVMVNTVISETRRRKALKQNVPHNNV